MPSRQFHSFLCLSLSFLSQSPSLSLSLLFFVKQWLKRPVFAETNSDHQKRVARVTIFKPAHCNECDARKSKEKIWFWASAFAGRILVGFCIIDIHSFNIEQSK